MHSAQPTSLWHRHKNATGADPEVNRLGMDGCPCVGLKEVLGAARSRRLPLPEIVLWSTASQHPSESQTSECSDLLSRSRATCLIVAQRQPGKLTNHGLFKLLLQRPPTRTGASATLGILDEMLVARGHTKIRKITLDDLKLTAIFSKRRKIGSACKASCVDVG